MNKFCCFLVAAFATFVLFSFSAYPAFAAEIAPSRQVIVMTVEPTHDNVVAYQVTSIFDIKDRDEQLPGPGQAVRSILRKDGRVVGIAAWNSAAGILIIEGKDIDLSYFCQNGAYPFFVEPKDGPAIFVVGYKPTDDQDVKNASVS